MRSDGPKGLARQLEVLRMEDHQISLAEARAMVPRAAHRGSLVEAMVALLRPRKKSAWRSLSHGLSWSLVVLLFWNLHWDQPSSRVGPLWAPMVLLGIALGLAL